MNGADQFDTNTELSENVRTKFFIDGKWVQPNSTGTLKLISPITEEIILQTPEAGQADINEAIHAARKAFDFGAWPQLKPHERGKYLAALATEMRKRESLLERTWTAQVGAPAWFSGAFTGLAASYFEYYAQLASTFAFEEDRKVRSGIARVVREPIGVCALIVPWNAPLILLSQKLAAALLSGCTVVVKPSPETPLDALILAECAEAAGLPDGVLNVVPAGREGGDWLIRQPQVDKVSFTGSTAAGKHIAAVCSERLARVSLELGGKSASIFCDDADISTWLNTVAAFTMPFSGQICFSQTRVLVSHRRHDEFVEAFASAVGKMTIGSPWDSTTHIGPLSTSRQRDRVLGYIESGKREGARLVTGGDGVRGLNQGYFVAPTIFDRVTSDMAIAREEIFGPVVSIIEFADEEEAIRIANSSDYGLSGTVFTNDLERGEKIARRIRTGNISINGLQLDPSAPFGGYKQSGIGREGGPEGLEPYLETKTLYIPAEGGR